MLPSYFHRNICAKNCRNRTVYIKIIASQRWDVFMVALCNRTDHYIFMLWSVLVLLFFFPRLISAAADWTSAILPHIVWS